MSRPLDSTHMYYTSDCVVSPALLKPLSCKHVTFSSSLFFLPLNPLFSPSSPLPSPLSFSHSPPSLPPFLFSLPSFSPFPPSLPSLLLSLPSLPTPFLLTSLLSLPPPSPPSSPPPPLPQSTECEHAVWGACTHQDSGRMGTRDESRCVRCGPHRGSTTPPECDAATATLPAATGGLVAGLPQDIHTGRDSKMCSKISNNSITLKAIYSRGFMFRKLLRVK